jgi:hypothetical protein
MQELLGIQKECGTVLQSPPRLIRVLHRGEWYLARRYTGAPFSIIGAVILPGDYMGLGRKSYGLHRTVAWLAQNPTKWVEV